MSRPFLSRGDWDKAVLQTPPGRYTITRDGVVTDVVHVIGFVRGGCGDIGRIVSVEHDGDQAILDIAAFCPKCCDGFKLLPVAEDADVRRAKLAPPRGLGKEKPNEIH